MRSYTLQAQHACKGMGAPAAAPCRDGDALTSAFARPRPQCSDLSKKNGEASNLAQALSNAAARQACFSSSPSLPFCRSSQHLYQAPPEYTCATIENMTTHNTHTLQARMSRGDDRNFLKQLLTHTYAWAGLFLCCAC